MPAMLPTLLQPATLRHPHQPTSLSLARAALDGRCPTMYSDLADDGAAPRRPITLNHLLVYSAATALGLTMGILATLFYLHHEPEPPVSPPTVPHVSFLRQAPLPQDNTLSLIKDHIYWGDLIEDALPEDGFHPEHHHQWATYLESAVAVKLTTGCGRMQNRLVTFEDGVQGCVRYRQNTDQIQGELFSFYLSQLLNLPNLAPSTVAVVNLQVPLWRNLAQDIAAAQWHSNKPVVVTRYIPDLRTANIPPIFKPMERHLNKFDVFNMTGSLLQGELIGKLVELAQWSDLIVFDYLTANLDRVVNNLYNYQWNANIMDAPAHNLARRRDLLVFLDNESGLLHGYRLLKKYEVYHSLLLENLCVFRKETADAVRTLRRRGNVGQLLRERFERENGDVVKDLLPTLPEKSVKILKERIERVYAQIVKCEAMFKQ